MRLALAAMVLLAVCLADAHGAGSDDIHVLSDIDNGRIEIHVSCEADAGAKLGDCTAQIRIVYPDRTERVLSALGVRETSPGQIVIDAGIDPVMVWHPKTPNLYHLKLRIMAPNGTEVLAGACRFGMRKLEHRGARFHVNNQPFYVRACGHEREDRCDNIDRDGALKRLRQVRRYGFNVVRHHSHVPNEDYLSAADEVGVFIQMEIGGKIGTDPQSERYQQSKRDWTAIIETGRRHPCTFVYSMGNEIYKNDPGLIRCQDLLYELARQMDPTPLVLNRSGSSPFNDAHGKYDLIERPIGEYEHLAPLAREAFMLYLRGDRAGRSGEFPIIAHEYPLVAAYPNPALAHKYDQTPAWLKLTVENARKHGLEHLLPDFTRNAQRIQTICRKEMLEEARKFPELDGYSMLRFTDCGERVSGVVDDFADPKDVTAEEFLRTNGETVLVCTWNKRNFHYGEQLEATIEVSHHGPTPFAAPGCEWQLMNGHSLLATGSFGAATVDAVDVAGIGRVALTVPTLRKPAKLTLRAYLPGTTPQVINEWHCWAFPRTRIDEEEQKRIIVWDPRERLVACELLYPEITHCFDPSSPPTTATDRLVITDSWHEAFYDFLDRGGRIWVVSDKSWPWPEEIGIFGLHITRMIPSDQAPVVFPELDEHCNKWMTICSNARSRHGNSGTLIRPHPALGDFPHEGFCSLQFWPMVYRAKSLQLDRFPASTEPIIRTIDSFYRGRSKGYMAELAVGRGRVFISTLNFTQFLDRDVATAYLFDQILRYVTGPNFLPQTRMTTAELRTMIERFAVEHAERKPLTRDEMPARYTTRWKWLLTEGDLIALPLYDAGGVDESHLAVHWEYAQTQWYLNARPGDKISWSFTARRTGRYTCTLPLAGTVEGVKLLAKLDDREAVPIVFGGSDGWESFVPHRVELHDVTKGPHRLTVSIPGDAPTQDGRTVQIREVELRSVAAE